MIKDKFTFTKNIGKSSSGSVCDMLASTTGLSKSRIKDAMNKGALWVGKEQGRLRRLRKATSMLHTNMRLEFYYDEKLLALKPPQARLIEDLKDYSVWNKPAGLLAQGTMYGDHCSLLRQAELYFGNMREVFLVHRIDREAWGLMLIAHTKSAAAQLSELFQKNLIVKRYRVEVLGNISERSLEGTIDMPLAEKQAITEFEFLSYDPEKHTSTVDVIIRTGRLHQIRRHFDSLGYPVIGDPKYGKRNKNTDEGLKLVAYSLAFKCPFRNSEIEFNLETA